jgi:hypothetical protein
MPSESDKVSQQTQPWRQWYNQVENKIPTPDRNKINAENCHDGLSTVCSKGWIEEYRVIQSIMTNTSDGEG